MNSDEVWQLFMPLSEEFRPEDTFPHKRPLLAHYTSIDVLEKIFKQGEIWFSNPLLMNDLQEVRFGIEEGEFLVLDNQEIPDALGPPEQYRHFKQYFDHYRDEFANSHAFDTYVFCLSEHESSDTDGLLSMWRGYGSDGNGAAVVFDTSKIDNETVGSPLIIAKVQYASTEARKGSLQSMVSKFAKILQEVNLPGADLYLAAYALFEHIKLRALFTKHDGFEEEREWRIVYMPERDRENKLKHMLDYSIGPRGVEPKLKFKTAPMDGVTPNDFSLEKIVDRILLGPSISSPFSKAAILRMFDRLNTPAEIRNNVHGSSIPFRAVRR